MVQDFILSQDLAPINRIEQILPNSMIFWFYQNHIFSSNVTTIHSESLERSTNSPTFIVKSTDSFWSTKMVPLFQHNLSNFIEGYQFGTYQNHPCILLFSKIPLPSFGQICSNCEPEMQEMLQKSFFPLRNFFGKAEPDLILIAGIASQLSEWLNNSQFCGRCGQQLSPMKNLFALHCKSCHLQVFPQIAPAIIVAISKGDSLLLAHNSNFPKGLFSIIAGFCNPGESAEETIRREIQEEVGIEVKNIHYFGSQPWPFPNSLMLGYTAEWASGEIHVDGREIVDARWFKPEEIPTLPSTVSISRTLIDHFLNTFPKINKDNEDSS